MKPRKINYRTWITVIFVVCVALFNILYDYVSVSFDPSIFCNAEYWVTTLLINGSALMIMFSMRSAAKIRYTDRDEGIQTCIRNLDECYISLSQRKLMSEFDEYVKAENLRRKKAAYKAKLTNRLRKCRKEKKKAELEQRLGKLEEEIEDIKVRYHAVKVGTLFSMSNIKTFEDENLDISETGEIVMRTLSKAVGMLGVGIFGLSLTITNGELGLSLIVTTVFKVLQIALAIYLGVTDGEGFAREVILPKLKLRLKFVQQFLEQRSHE